MKLQQKSIRPWSSLFVHLFLRRQVRETFQYAKRLKQSVTDMYLLAKGGVFPALDAGCGRILVESSHEASGEQRPP